MLGAFYFKGMNNVLKTLAAATLVLGLGSAVSAQTINGLKLDLITAQYLEVAQDGQVDWGEGFEELILSNGKASKRCLRSVNELVKYGYEVYDYQVFVVGQNTRKRILPKKTAPDSE